MHELSITENILQIALKHGTLHAPGRPITGINLVIGQLSSVIDNSVQFYWDIVASSTAAEGAQLHFDRRPAELLCLDCSRRYNPSQGELSCPDCGGTNIEIISGDEFFMESIEVA
jgi:hydrogenase nickel incorporation protein HypA/HybF